MMEYDSWFSGRAIQSRRHDFGPNGWHICDDVTYLLINESYLKSHLQLLKQSRYESHKVVMRSECQDTRQDCDQNRSARPWVVIFEKATRVTKRARLCSAYIRTGSSAESRGSLFLRIQTQAVKQTSNDRSLATEPGCSDQVRAHRVRRRLLQAPVIVFTRQTAPPTSQLLSACSLRHKFRDILPFLISPP